MNRHERRATARGSQKNASGPGADTSATLYEAGLRHMRAARYLDAQTCCRQGLAIDAGHAGILHLMGLLSLQAKQYDHAVAWMARAVGQDPRPEYLLSLGTALRPMGRHQEALLSIDKAVQLKPEDADLWKALGDVLVELERPADALLSFQHVLRLDPRHWDAANQCGMILHRSGRLEEALACFSLCDGWQPNEVATLSMRAICLDGLKRFEEALADTRRAQALDPANAELCNNVGILLRKNGRDEAALEWFDRALELRSDFTDALHNKAVSFTQTRKFDEAFAVYDGLKATDPKDALADLGLAHLHLLNGNFEAGWAGREVRWQIPSFSAAYPKLPQPMWLGNSGLEGKTILIGADEGFGDTIQFARYVPMVAERGACVVLVVQDPLHRLMSDLPGVSQCVPISATTTNKLPAFDLHCPMMSLPLAFATRLDTVPSPASYLPRPAQTRLRAWQDRLGPHDRLRVGLVWSGNPKHRNDHNRSLPLRALARLLDLDATFVSLQKDPKPADKATLLERADIFDLTGLLDDFAETAALVCCLDLVITVDTSIAHLAGALGRPTWILLPYVPDYRWLLDRDDTPWYPTARLFRQTETREYGAVIDRIRSELLTRIAAFRPEVR
jgi:tetratricopeptide (TPR) repeat protein